MMQCLQLKGLKLNLMRKKNTKIFLAICKEFLLLCIEISETKHNPLHKPLYLFHFSYDYEHEFNKTGSVFFIVFQCMYFTKIANWKFFETLLNLIYTSSLLLSQHHIIFASIKCKQIKDTVGNGQWSDVNKTVSSSWWVAQLTG